jgi:F-type H+-transporting ATPase subunit b
MNHFFFLGSIASDLAAAARNTGEAFGFHWTLFISQLVSFVLVAFLLHRFAYKPILLVLAERRQRIAEGLENAERIKAELARTEVARQEVLNEANLQANKLIEEARAAAARVQEVETQKAIASAEQILARAREAAATEHARMLSELKQEIGRLVVDTTSAVTGKVLTMEDQRRLVEETNRQLAA